MKEEMISLIDGTAAITWRIRHNGKTYWTHTIRQQDIDPGKGLWNKFLAWWNLHHWWD